MYFIDLYKNDKINYGMWSIVFKRYCQKMLYINKMIVYCLSNF